MTDLSPISNPFVFLQKRWLGARKILGLIPLLQTTPLFTGKLRPPTILL